MRTDPEAPPVPPTARRSHDGPAPLGNVHPSLADEWYPVALSTEVTDAPVGVRLLGRDLVLARLGPHADQLVLTADRCSHRHAPLRLGSIEDGCLQCPYHGWRFDAGLRCVATPSMGDDAPTPPTAHLDGLRVLECDGVVWGSIGRPAGAPPAFAEHDMEGFDLVVSTPVRTGACAGRLVENFLDVTHFPFLHRGTFGADDAVEGGAGEITDLGPGFRHELHQPFLNREDPAVVAGTRPLVQHRTLTYTWLPPFCAHLRIRWLEAGITKAILFLVRPEDDTTCHVVQLISRDDLGGDPAAIERAREFEDAVFDEDRSMLEGSGERSLPLDLRDEVHLRTDRPTVELRRRLAAMVG